MQITPSSLLESALSLRPSQLQPRLDRARYHAQHRSLVKLLSWAWYYFHFGLEPREKRPSQASQDAVRKRFEDLLAADLENVARGHYPRDLLFQFPALSYLKTLPEGLPDIPRMLWKRRREDHATLPPGVTLEDYPRYYRRTFHWQTDGWFSDHSARVYDLAVEMLFLGTADIMRRMAIPPVSESVRSMRRPRILDVACGTGSFLHQLHRALPRAKLYGLDLSPHYLRRAAGALAGVPDTSFLAENAESMPLEDASFDAVTSIYLFHELPGNARRNVMREALRVLKPGGRFVVVDSVQWRDPDARALKPLIDWFPTHYHEPYYKGYQRDPLQNVLEESGFRIERTLPAFVSKVVVARKPGTRARRNLTH